MITGNNLGMMAGMMKPCTRMARSGVRDGQGGRDEAWTDGDTFPALITRIAHDKTTVGDKLIAEQRRTLDMYRVVVERDVRLSKNDVLRRDADGLTVRMTSDTVGSESPDIATVQIAVGYAEGWEIP